VTDPDHAQHVAVLVQLRQHAGLLHLLRLPQAHRVTLLGTAPAQGSTRARPGACRREAEVQGAALPRQELEGALLLLFIERAHQLQLHLPVARYEAVVLRQHRPRHRADRHDHLRRAMVACSVCTPLRCRTGRTSRRRRAPRISQRKKTG